MCWCSLDNIAIYLGEHYPRLWLVIGQYKNCAKFLTILVVFLQLIRISFVAYEWRFINAEYPESETIAFCTISIILGIISLGLESLLLYAIQTNNIKKIQPWFLCTFLIFLFASLAFVISGTLYVIRPIDHNVHVGILQSKTNLTNYSLQSNQTDLEKDGNGTGISNDNDTTKRFMRDSSSSSNNNRSNMTNSSWPAFTQSTFDSYEYMMEEGNNGSGRTIASTESSMDKDTEECAPGNSTHNGTCKLSLAVAGYQILAIKKITISSSNENKPPKEVLQNGKCVPEGNDNSPADAAAAAAATKAAEAKVKKGRKGPQVMKNPHNETYAVHPIVPLSYFLDVIRCIPQLFLVNRFVKTEQLHEHLIHPSHSHTSLSALYVKPIPVLV